MSILPIIFIIIVIHFILCTILLIYCLTRETSLRKENIVPIILVPIFAPLAAIILEWIHFSNHQGEKLEEILLEPLGDDILWKTIKNHHEVGNIVPLEEALLINENKTKRKMILNALYDDPLKYLDVLLIASHNEDVETAHYATTTISHTQRKFQINLHKTKIAVEENPNNLQLLDHYIELLEIYIDSGLLEEYLLQNQRKAYAQALEKKLAINDKDKTTLIKKLRNCVKLEEYSDAFEIGEKLKRYWPHDEDVWNEVLRVCIEGKDKKKFQASIDEIQNTPIQWTKQGKDRINLWILGAK